VRGDRAGGRQPPRRDRIGGGGGCARPLASRAGSRWVRGPFEEVPSGGGMGVNTSTRPARDANTRCGRRLASAVAAPVAGSSRALPATARGKAMASGSRVRTHASMCGAPSPRSNSRASRSRARTASASGPSSVITARRPVALAASGRHSATLCAQWPPAPTERSKATGSSCGLAVIRIAPRAVDAVTASGPAASSTARLRRARTGPSRQPLTAARSPRASWQGRRRPPPAGPRARWAPRPGRRTTAGSRPRPPGRRPDRPARWSQSRRPIRRRRRTGLR